MFPKVEIYHAIVCSLLIFNILKLTTVLELCLLYNQHSETETNLYTYSSVIECWYSTSFSHYDSRGQANSTYFFSSSLSPHLGLPHVFTQLSLSVLNGHYYRALYPMVY